MGFKKYQVGVIGATGMVGQRFVQLLREHPWFEVKVLAASGRSAGKTYEEVLNERNITCDWIPEHIRSIVIQDAVTDAEKIANDVDFVFCAIDIPKDQTRELEERYAKLECPVISNNSANRGMADVPMMIPEINPEHANIIPAQQKRLGTSRGFIAVKSNCSLQSYVPAVHPLWDLGVEKIATCTYQAISGAGKTFDTWPEMVGNVIPFIGGEEEKSQVEPLKIWGTVTGDKIVNAASPNITAQCLRVPVVDGHFAATFITLEKKTSPQDIIARWNSFEGEPQILKLPSAPKKMLYYFEEDNRPQVTLDVNLESGMAVSIGRLRKDTLFDYKFVSLSHNTLRGAAGGAVLMAELLCAEPPKGSPRTFAPNMYK